MAKAIFLIQSLDGGGAERVVSRLLAALASGSRPASYHLALLEPKVTYTVPDGVPVHVLAGSWRSSIGALVMQVRALVKLVRLVHREKPDAVISFMLRSNVINLVAKACVPRWPRTVVSERTSLKRSYIGRSARRIRLVVRWLYALADAIVAVSVGVADELKELGAPADRLVVIPNPVSVADLEAQAASGLPHPWSQRPGPLLVTVGRLSPEKGHAVLLRALRRVRERFPARLVVMGDGPERALLEAEAARLGVQDAVAWAGYNPNPFPTVARADVFVLPSLWEGFPNALLEAMALGRPVVATACHLGPRDLLGDGAHGLLVPPGDAEALAAGVERLLASEGLRREYGARARRRAADYALAGILERYRAVIETRGPGQTL